MMSEPHRFRRLRRFAWIGLVGAAVLLLVAGVGWGVTQARRAEMERRLTTLLPNEVETHLDLVKFAAAEGAPLFQRHCASCHGADMKGRADIGAPNLVDASWLYEEGEVFDIERAILYGIRSDQKKSFNITEMPAFGLRGQLSEGDINNVVQYLLQLSRRPHDAQAAALGEKVFDGPAVCGDCHSPDGKGNPSYGAPDLTIDVWNYGGTPSALYNSIYYGRHGVMPAWIGKLTLPQIRALAVYVYSASHR